MIHVGELSLEERGAMELLESARSYLAEWYASGGDWREYHHMTASTLLRELVTAIRVDAAARRTG